MKKRLLCCLLAALILLTAVSAMAPRSLAADTMTTSKQLIAVLKKMEGFAPRAYWDNSQWSVGYGTRCPDDKLSTYDAATGRDITEAEAEALLQQMLLGFETDVNNLIQRYSLSLSQYEFDALVCFTYNLGGAWTYNEDSALNRAVRSGLTGTDLVYAMSLYSMVGADYDLIHRRLSEAYLYLDGQYEAYNDSSDGTYPYRYRHVYLDGNGGETLYTIHGYTAADPKAPKSIFTKIPTGVDAQGNPFIYTFAGWYTSATGGSKVETLDGSLPSGTVLYAQWADPSGTVTPLPKGTPLDHVSATVLSQANVRTGPGTFYTKTGHLAKDTVVTLTQVYNDGELLWGCFDGGWICLSYTDYAGPAAPSQPGISGVSLVTPPTDARCVQGQLLFNLDGSVLKITYSDGSIGAMTVNTDMIVSCDTRALGQTTATASYAGFTVTFPVTVEKATITFRLADGTVLSEKQYALGEEVEVPSLPQQDGEYIFKGWSSKVIPCNGNKVYTAIYVLEGATEPTDPEPSDPTDPAPPVPQWPRTGIITHDEVNVRTGPGTGYDRADYQLNTGNMVIIHEVVYDGQRYNWGRMENGHWVCMDYVKLLSIESASLPGDMNGDGIVTKDDAIYLLRHVVFPDRYPVAIDADINADNTVNKDDAIYLLRHVVFPDRYPLIYG